VEKMMTTAIINRNPQSLNPLQSVKTWLDRLEIQEANSARQIVKLIPLRPLFFGGRLNVPLLVKFVSAIACFFPFLLYANSIPSTNN
jgi:Mo-dependent nitrogenase C-terminus